MHTSPAAARRGAAASAADIDPIDARDRRMFADTATGPGHLVLTGDSIIDNSAYVGPDDPDVAAQVAAALPGWRVTSLARDGALIADVRERQLPRVPADATHLLICVGGNDLLRERGILAEPARCVGRALLALDAVADDYVAAYAAMLCAAFPLGLPIACCLAYNPRFEPGHERAAARAAVCLFHDRTRSLVEHTYRDRGVAVVDLRHVCALPECYANAIEPSRRGGEKIAAAVAAAVTGRGGEAR